MMPQNILLIGATGQTGRNLTRLLCTEPALRLYLSSRKLARARSYIESLNPDGGHKLASRRQPGAISAQQSPPVLAELLPCAVNLHRIDRLKATIEDLNLDLIVDCCGVLQNATAHRQPLLELCLEMKIDYLDISGERSFTGKIGYYDQAAKARSIAMLSGAGSLPCLSAAALQSLDDGIQIQTISVGYSPSPKAKIGERCLNNLLGSTGAVMMTRQDALVIPAVVGEDQQSLSINVPGALPLHRSFSRIDAPDHTVLAERYPSATSVFTGIAEQAFSLKLLRLLARLRHYRLLPDLSYLTKPLFWLQNIVQKSRKRRPFMQSLRQPLKHPLQDPEDAVLTGNDQTGMIVAISGFRTAKPESGEATVTSPIRRSWQLLAQGTDGDLINVMGAAILIRRRLAGRRPRPGARAAADDLKLDDFEAAFAGYHIRSGQRRPDETPQQCLYERQFDGSFQNLAAELQLLHKATLIGRGRGSIMSSYSLGSYLLTRSLGWPLQGLELPISYSCERQHLGQQKSHDPQGRETAFQETAFQETCEWRFGQRSKRLPAIVTTAGSGTQTGLVLQQIGRLQFGYGLLMQSPTTGQTGTTPRHCEELNYLLRCWSIRLGPWQIRLPLWLAPNIGFSEKASAGRYRFSGHISSAWLGIRLDVSGWLEPAKMNGQAPMQMPRHVPQRASEESRL